MKVIVFGDMPTEIKIMLNMLEMGLIIYLTERMSFIYFINFLSIK